MATENIFNREVKANKSPRNAFDLSYSSLFTSPVGQLLPTYVQEVKRGDKLKLGVTSLTRTRPVQTAAFMSFDEKLDFWFVPYSLLWSDYENWRLGQTFRYRTTNLQGAGKQNYMPFMTYNCISRYFQEFSSDYVNHKLNAFNNHPSTALRYLDLLGYSVPDNSGQVSYYWVNKQGPADGRKGQNLWFIATHYSGLNDTTPINYFRLCAFQCIYQHSYRCEEYETLDPSTYNCDTLFYDLTYDNNIQLEGESTPTSLSWSLNEEYLNQPLVKNKLNLAKLFMPRYKNWRKDLFTSAKPDAGFNLGVTGLEFDTTLQPSASSLYGSGFYWPNNTGSRRFPLGGSVTDEQTDRYNPLADLDANSYNDTRIDWTYQSADDNPANVVQRLYTELNSDKSFGLTFLYPQNIRNLMAQDKFSRSVIYADKDYSSQVKALFGEDVEDYHKPTYLGSYSINVTIDDVTATSDGTASDDDPSKTTTSILGQLSGKVKQGNEQGDIFSREFKEDGIVMGIHYIMPRNNYDSYRINKWNTKISRFDFFYPQFDGLGYQPILAYERNVRYDGEPVLGQEPEYYNTLFGFAPRYYEYKTRQNEVHGSFQTNQSDYDWTATNNQAFLFNANNPVNYKIYPKYTDRLFAVGFDGSSNTDPFMHYYYYDATLVSDMEIYGTPSL